MPITGPDLTSERLRLRPLRPEDAPEIARLLNDWEVARYTASIPHPYSLKDAEEFIATQINPPVDPPTDETPPIICAVELNPQAILVGCVGLLPEAEQAVGLEIGYWIGREFWSRGFATEAVGRFVRYAFEELGAEEIHAAAVKINDASNRVLETIGFQITGSGEIHSVAQNCALPVFHRRLTRAMWDKRGPISSSWRADGR
jgi:RimJ/RimL family protein N-acetyltransferase